ncbi:hypothetical protein BDN71DRAFT_1018707 [Pleurotus eryngii]|uniref:Uncharacterized protein n=1 Tax=Pleurotus eryngii TaxID=5323 RepID=A0A9P5ZUM1_PLEER|nr:hypothetical protein BDN71DRAFT_1018707 [Pleurotus eryngii]
MTHIGYRSHTSTTPLFTTIPFIAPSLSHLPFSSQMYNKALHMPFSSGFCYIHRYQYLARTYLPQ